MSKPITPKQARAFALDMMRRVEEGRKPSPPDYHDTEEYRVRLLERKAALCDQLAEALEELIDWQNGPPLLSRKWTDGWGRAMVMARSAIAEYDALTKDTTETKGA